MNTANSPTQISEMENILNDLARVIDKESEEITTIEIRIERIGRTTPTPKDKQPPAQEPGVPTVIETLHKLIRRFDENNSRLSEIRTNLTKMVG